MRSINLSHVSDLAREQLTRILAAWRDLSPIRRRDLIAAMVEQAEADIHLNFHAILRECLADPEAAVRRLAIEGLWEDERPSLVSPLVRLLTDDVAAEVRAAAASSLGRFVLLGVLGELAESYAFSAEDALRRAWVRPGEVTEVRRRVLESLAYVDDLEVLDLIDTAYYDEEDVMRQSAVFAMGRSANRRWARVVLNEFGSQDVAMRFEAAGAAGEMGLRAAVNPLIQLLNDPDSSVREAAALALGKIGGPLARRALQARLLGRDVRLAEAAQEALAELAFNSGAADHPLLDLAASDKGRSRPAERDDDSDDDEDSDEDDAEDDDGDSWADDEDDLDDDAADDEWDDEDADWEDDEEEDAEDKGWGADDEDDDYR